LQAFGTVFCVSRLHKSLFYGYFAVYWIYFRFTRTSVLLCKDRPLLTHANFVSRACPSKIDSRVHFLLPGTLPHFEVPEHQSHFLHAPKFVSRVSKIDSLFDIYILSASIVLFCPLSSGTSSLLKSKGPTKVFFFGTIRYMQPVIELLSRHLAKRAKGAKHSQVQA
jgi:hypothetical protein